MGLLLYNGGTVCDDSFSGNSANAICKYMGYAGKTMWTSGRKFDIQSDYEITLNDVACTNTEWESCSYSEWHYFCYHYKDVFLSCSLDVKIEVDTRGFRQLFHIPFIISLRSYQLLF